MSARFKLLAGGRASAAFISCTKGCHRSSAGYSDRLQLCAVGQPSILKIFCNIGGHSTGPFQKDSSNLAAAPVTPRAIRSATSSMARATSSEGQLPCSNRLPSML